MFKIVALILFFKTALVFAQLHLPSYLTACRKSDPQIDKCITENANKAIPIISKGDETYGIPLLEPFFLKHITLDASENLFINFHDLEVRGLRSTKIVDCNIKPQQKEVVNITGSADRLELTGKYKIKGNLLLLQLDGEGTFNLTLVDANALYAFKWVTFKKKGTEYARISEYSSNVHIKKGYFYLDNIFKGNKELSDTVNNILNENDQEILAELKPAIDQTVGNVIYTVANNFFTKIPYAELLLE